MQTYSEEITALSQEVAGHERDLQILNDFINKGGQYRISVTVDHPVATVRETVERLSSDGFPAEKVLQILVARSKLALKAAKSAVFQRAAVDELTAEPAAEGASA